MSETLTLFQIVFASMSFVVSFVALVILIADRNKKK